MQHITQITFAETILQTVIERKQCDVVGRNRICNPGFNRHVGQASKQTARQADIGATRAIQNHLAVAIESGAAVKCSVGSAHRVMHDCTVGFIEAITVNQRRQR